MKRYIQLAKHYADYKKFCDVLERVCLINNMEVVNNNGYFYNPTHEQEVVEYELVYMLYNNPELAELAISFAVTEFMLRKYPHAFAVIEAVHLCVDDPTQFYMDHIYSPW